MLETFKIVFENIKNLFSCGLSSGLFWSMKYQNFWEKPDLDSQSKFFRM